MPLSNVVVVDLTVWILCLIALLSFARLSASHPATIYLLFHFFLFSARAVAILSGATTLFSWRGTSPLTEAEIARALLVADLALVTMSCAWITVAHRMAKASVLNFQDRGRALNPVIIRTVAVIAIPCGCIAMLLWGRFPGMTPYYLSGGWSDSNWIVIAQTWAGLSLIALIYWYGFKPTLSIPMLMYLAWVAYQGNFRFRLLIPIILLLQIYLDRRDRRWPKASAMALLIACGFLFFPLKEIGRQLQAGAGSDNIWHVTADAFGDVLRGSHPDQMVLDEFASVLTLADAHGTLYWGRTYAGLFTVAIPRQWWPEKPGLVDFQKEISTPARPMAENGMVMTMFGEFYLNFSYFGVIVLSFAMAYFTGAFFHAAYQRGYFTLARFTYLLVACNLIQVYRDGLISLFVFLVINMMPLTAIVVLHLLWNPRQEFEFRRGPILSVPRVRPRSERQPTA
jgi:hypothetical protein